MSQPTDPFGVPPQPKPGMSTGAKVFLGLGLGCGVVLLICCGGFGLFGYFAAQGLKPTEDPIKVREEANLIASVEVPPALEPKTAINFTMPFVNKKVFSVAVFADKAEHSSLVLFELASDIGDPNQMLAEFEKSMAESGQEDGINTKKLPVTDLEEIKTEVNGKPAVFEVGKATEGERELWQASGAFSGKGGAAMLIMQLNAADFSKEDAINVVKSIK